MTEQSDQPVVILEVAGEGGGYTILGEQHLGRWRFWRDSGGSDAWMWDDDNEGVVDDDLLPESTSEPAREPITCYSHTLDEVLEEINSCWPHLHPVQVNAGFAQDIWSRVETYWHDNADPQKRSIVANWSEVCLGR